MQTVTDPDRFEQTLFRAADVLGFDLAWECLEGNLAPPPPLVSPSACRSLAGWIDDQSSFYRLAEGDVALAREGLLLVLVAETLDDLAVGVRQRRSTTPREYAATTWPFWDLDAVTVPAHRASPLAEDLDGEARAFLAIATDAGNLCAAAILWLAEEAEAFGSRDAEDYLRARDRRDDERCDRLAADFELA